MRGRFEADLSAFAALTEKKMRAILQQSAQDVIADMQRPKGEGGNLPVDTGNLRNSLQVRVNNALLSQGAESYVMAIASADIGDVINAAYAANYARRMEYGFVGADKLGRNYNQPGSFFVRNAAVKWASIVRNNALKVERL